MPEPRLLNIYLTPDKQRRLTEGTGIWGRIAAAIQQAGWHLRLRDGKEAVSGPGHHLIYNSAITEPHCLVLRRAYIEPFYRIEATNDRWDWQVARLAFPGGGGAEWFLKHWQRRLFADTPITSGGYIFMPLQGKLLDHRHFQAMRPIDMIHATLAADPARPVIATLHPRETYSAEERAALAQIGGRFTLHDGPSLPLLAGCDYVVAENSAMALTGFFARKPAVLFARIDFHHIAGSVPDQGVAAAFASVTEPRPFARYLHWFLRDQAISAEADDAPDRISAAFRAHGWPI